MKEQFRLWLGVLGAMGVLLASSLIKADEVSIPAGFLAQEKNTQRVGIGVGETVPSSLATLEEDLAPPEVVQQKTPQAVQTEPVEGRRRPDRRPKPQPLPDEVEPQPDPVDPVAPDVPSPKPEPDPNVGPVSPVDPDFHKPKPKPVKPDRNTLTDWDALHLKVINVKMEVEEAFEKRLTTVFNRLLLITFIVVALFTAAGVLILRCILRTPAN